MKKILISGATGQMGSELFPALCDLFGPDNVIAMGHQREPEFSKSINQYYSLDIRDKTGFDALIHKHHIDTVFHLASLLSAVAEQNPQRAWDININGLLNVLDTSVKYGCSVFFPSSIGAFGPGTPKINTPQDTIQRPNSMYGITKVTGELLCDYYQQHHGVDTRGLRFPGLVSYKTLPGGGTTDYAVEIFFAAARTAAYECFLEPDTRLDMMYMPDAIAAIINLMQADSATLKHRNAFNITAMSFTPEQLANEIKKHIPEFEISYRVDPVRQKIADSWPQHMDDSAARYEWGWRPLYDLPKLVEDMLDHIRRTLCP